MKKITKLTAHLVHGKGKNGKSITRMTIVIPHISDAAAAVVARAVKPGRWTLEATLAEFHRLPSGFKTEPGYEVAKAMKLAA